VNGPAGRVSFQITYHGGSGRDVVLTRPSAATTGTASYVVGLYQDLLQRQPDGGGLAFFTGLLNAGTPRTTVVLETGGPVGRSRGSRGTGRAARGGAPGRLGSHRP